MARFIYQGVAQDTSGTVIKEATVTVYLAGTTTAATIYAAETGDAESDNTVSTSATTGAFSFWIDTDDYALTQRFKIVISKTGYTSQTLDNINIIGNVAASSTGAGLIEFSTDAETVTGTSTSLGTTPANLTAKMKAPGAIGGTTPAPGSFTSLSMTTQAITDNSILTVDDADAADNDFAKFTASGLEGRSYAEVKTDLGFDYDTIWIPASAMVSTTTNGAAASSYEFGTNDNMVDYLAFDGATEEYAAFNIPMHEAWDRSTIKAKFYWAPGDSACSENDTVEWQLAGQAISNDDALDVAMGDAGEVISDAVTAGKDGDLHITSATPAITVGGTPALADMVHFKVSRNIGGDDDMTEDAWLFGVLIQYKKTNVTAAW